MAAMSYLQRHPKSGVYRVRRPIPPGARAAFEGRKEYLRTLETKDVTEAKRLAFSILAEVQSKIDRALAGAVFWQTHDMGDYLTELAEWSGCHARLSNTFVYDSRNWEEGRN